MGLGRIVKTVSRGETVSHLGRTVALLGVDAILVNAALLLALWFRFDGVIPHQYLYSYRMLAPVFTLICLAIFYACGLYHRLWQYASLGDLFAIGAAVSLSTLVHITYSHILIRSGDEFLLPRTVFALSWVLIFVLIGASRLSLRLFRDLLPFFLPLQGGKPILIAGAGDTGVLVAREIKRKYSQNNHRSVVIGFVDDDPVKQKQKLCGLPVLGDRTAIPRLVEQYGVKEIIIAIPSAPGRVIREIVDICYTASVQLQILPGLYDQVTGDFAVSQIRRVEVEDLLGREPVKVNLNSIAAYLEGRTVLVSGAGGSIGSELCRQVLQFSPRRLVLLGHGENSIYEIHRELQDYYSGLEIRPVIADIKDEKAMDDVFVRFSPEVVFHAAAHKHLPLMEDNPAEAVKNNVLGTWRLAGAARRHRVETFVLISTDKAVNPTSIMGATKRVAEMIVQRLQEEADGGTTFAAVRFGNVLDSRGSVVPLFKQQIDRGGPVTVTHPEMTRFFMTIAEAVQLVIQAGALARGGEIFVLDMGDPTKIDDLARRMIRLAGFEPGRDIRIVYTGIRPGEKLDEEILTEQEGISATLHQRIFAARPDAVDSAALAHLLATAGSPGWNPGSEEVETLLQTVLPAFRDPRGRFAQLTTVEPALQIRENRPRG